MVKLSATAIIAVVCGTLIALTSVSEAAPSRRNNSTNTKVAPNSPSNPSQRKLPPTKSVQTSTPAGGPKTGKLDLKKAFNMLANGQQKELLEMYLKRQAEKRYREKLAKCMAVFNSMSICTDTAGFFVWARMAAKQIMDDEINPE